MSFYKLNGQPALDDGIDSGAAGPALQQGSGTPASDAPPSALGPAGSPTAPDSEVSTFVSENGGAPPASTNAAATTQTVTFANSGLVFNNTFDGISAAYQSCVLSAEQALASLCTNSITINVEFEAQAEGQNGELASNEFWTVGETYASLKTALTSLSSAEPGNTVLQQAVAHLPAADPSNGAGFQLPVAYAKMLGLSTPNQNPDVVTLNTSYNWNYGQDVINTLEHEISEGGMGRIGGLGDQNSFWSTMDLFRYNSSGQPDYTDGRDGQTTFFSYNGGATLSTLSFNNEYNTRGFVNGGDTADFTQQDVFGTGDPGETNTLSATDIQIMEALGWAPPVSVIRTDTNSYGSVDLAQVGNDFFLYAHGTTTGPEVKYNGSPLTATITTPWTPIGAVPTATGYEIAWRNPTTNQFTVWNVDSNGNELANPIGVVPANSTALEALEPSFNQDLNGDGIIGYPTPVVLRTDSNTYGVVDLAQLGNDFFLYSHGTTTGPEVKYNGSPLTASVTWPWAPVGAVQTSTGYEIAWKNSATNQFTVWNADSNGNELANPIGIVSGNSTALEALEPSFNQDLNGDGIIGYPTPVVLRTDTNSFGTVDLAQLGTDFFLYAHGTTTGPEVKYNGSPLTASLTWPWAPIGAVPTATGYEIAWQNTATNQFTVWNADSNGNELANPIGVVSANSTALEALEPSFNQDLNGDGVTGIYAPPGTTLQISQALSGASGATTIGSGAMLELSASDSATVTFQASTGMLKLDQPSTFSATIFGFTGNGTLSGSDQIDLPGISFASVHDSFLGGILSIGDGNGDGASLHFSGSYSPSNFKLTSDSSGGTIVYDPPPDLDLSGADMALSDPANGSPFAGTDLWSQTEVSPGWFSSPNLPFGEVSQSSLGELYDLTNFEFIGAAGSNGNGAPAPQPAAVSLTGAAHGSFGADSSSALQFGASGLATIAPAGAGSFTGTGAASEPVGSPAFAINPSLHA